MFLDNLLPASLGALAVPGAFMQRLKHPDMVSYGLLANLSAMQSKRVIHSIDSVWDVGANIGQFAFMAHYVWSNLPVYSFEPDPAVFGKLTLNRQRFSIPGEAFNCALGDQIGEVELFQCEDSVNNSLLEPAFADLQAQTDRVSVQCRTLDDVLHASAFQPERALLKLDVQGFEHAVIQGASEFLQHCRYTIIEVALSSKYRHAAQAEDILRLMRERGFECIQILDVLRSDDSSTILEMDLLFENKQGRS